MSVLCIARQIRYLSTHGSQSETNGVGITMSDGRKIGFVAAKRMETAHLESA